jgi:predicted RNA-binding Zn ribbon-like protein
MASSNNSKNRGDFVLVPRAAMCLDFANTLAYRGSSPAESLHTFADLLKWCGAAGSIPPSLAHQLRGWLDKHPKRAADLFSEAIVLRELIYRVFHAIASGANPDDLDLDLLNRALRDAPLRTIIQRTAEGFGWQVEESKSSASSILAPVLWSAGDLLVGPQLTKLRECSNDKCLWLFLDDSKNGTRRWCSMQACGNRAKAHRHYLRQKRA